MVEEYRLRGQTGLLEEQADGELFMEYRPYI